MTAPKYARCHACRTVGRTGTILGVPDGRDFIPYAGPEQQKVPRFQMFWGGWVLIAFLLLAVVVPLVGWLRQIL